MELVVNKSKSHLTNEIARIVNETGLPKNQVIRYIEHIKKYLKNKQNGYITTTFSFTENNKDVEYVFCSEYELSILVAKNMKKYDFNDIDEKIFFASYLPYSNYAIKHLLEVRENDGSFDEVIKELFENYAEQIAESYIMINGAGAYLGTEYKFDYLGITYHIFKLKK